MEAAEELPANYCGNITNQYATNARIVKVLLSNLYCGERMSSTSTTYSLCVDNHFSLERCVLISELGLYKADYLIIWTRRFSISVFVGPLQLK